MRTCCEALKSGPRLTLDLNFREASNDSVKACEKICDCIGVEFSDEMTQRIVTASPMFGLAGQFYRADSRGSGDIPDR